MPRRQRQRVGVQAGALVDVDEVQAAGLVADADLARAGLADRHLTSLDSSANPIGGTSARAA
jgi:hypothetical protein